MKQNRLPLILTSALIASVAIVGCKKKEETPPAPAATSTPAPAPAPAAATASVASVDLGSAVGDDFKVSAPATTFKPKDSIYAAVSTTTSDPAATVPGKLSAKWTYDHNGTPMTVNEEAKEVSFTSTGVTDFKISKPDGFPTGKYKVEVSLDGAVVQTKEFEVK
ncbi:MAG: hypothetical protein JF567_07500 [Xanthomonadales bacterium]|nr:hypothetical protein [Xanthomonadales bacterium]